MVVTGRRFLRREHGVNWRMGAVEAVELDLYLNVLSASDRNLSDVFWKFLQGPGVPKCDSELHIWKEF